MYETSSNLNLFEKEEKRKEEKEQQKRNSSLLKTPSYKKTFTETNKKERHVIIFNHKFSLIRNKI